MTNNLLYIHLTFGTIVSFLSIYLLTRKWSISILGAYILFWGNLIYTATILSFFSALGNPLLYFSVSIILFFLTFVLFWNFKAFLLKQDFSVSDNHFLNFRNWSAGFFSSTFIFFAIIVFILAFNYYPSDGDFSGYKITRVFHFLASGRFVPSSEIQGSDFFRTFNYPFNSALLHLFFLIYLAPHNSYGLVSFFSWIILALCMYNISRSLMISKLSSLVSSVIISISGVILFQATIEGDDLISSLPFSIGVYFFIIYLLSENTLYIFLSSLGIGIGMGAKGFPVFYFPFFILLTIYFFASERKSLQKLFTWKLVLGCLLISLSVFLQHPISKYFYSPEMKSLEIQSRVPLSAWFNLPIRWDTALFSTSVNFSNFLFSPIVEYFPNVGSPLWYAFDMNVNNFFHSNFWIEVPQSEFLVSKPVLNNSEFYSNKEYFGTTGIIILISLFYMFKKGMFRINPIPLFGFAFVCWFLTFSITHKYVASGRYWILAVALCAPLIGNLLDQIKKTFLPINIFVSVCLVSTILFAWANLTLDYHRNLIKIIFGYKDNGIDFPSSFKAVLSKSNKVNNLNTYWNFRNYDVLYNMATPRSSYADFSKYEAIPNFLNFAIVSRNNLKNENYPHKLLIPVEAPTKFDRNFVYFGRCLSGSLMVREETGGEYLDYKKGYLIFQPILISKDKNKNEFYELRPLFLEGASIPTFEIRITTLSGKQRLFNFPFSKLSESHGFKINPKADRILIELKKGNIITQKEYPISEIYDGGITN
jgi:hypothetical protein